MACETSPLVLIPVTQRMSFSGRRVSILRSALGQGQGHGQDPSRRFSTSKDPSSQGEQNGHLEVVARSSVQKAHLTNAVATQSSCLLHMSSFDPTQLTSLM